MTLITRRQITLAAASLAAPSLLYAGRPQRVAVIGAGAAGLTAAYHLKRHGADVVVFEASNRIGGRVKRLTGLSDMPLDLGAEWIHDDPTILGQIVGRGASDLGVETIEYRPQTYQHWHKGRLRNANALRHAYAEVKFLDTTWYGFFARFIVPEIRDTVVLEAPVARISRSDARGVGVHLQDGTTHDADAVLITVPLPMLQHGVLAIDPDIAPPHLSALRDIVFGKGLKVFLKFAQRFYPDLLFEGPTTQFLQDTWSSKLYYDAAFRKPTRDHLLALFTVSEGNLPRADLSDDALLRDVLDELSEIFGPVVRQSFQGGHVQNWSQEPFIQGSYSMSNDSDHWIEDILTPVAGRVFFAGEALGGDAQSTVHGAAFSAIAAVDQMLDR